jgi:hypothetical protein
MAMSAPTVVNMRYSDWIAGQGSSPITYLGTIQTDPTINSSIVGGIAQLYFNQVTNTLLIDNVS